VPATTDKAHITAVIDGRRPAERRYWNWPRLPHEPGRLEKLRDFFCARRACGARAWFTRRRSRRTSRPVPRAVASRRKGAPLHLVNVTINETLDGRTGVQMQDRKGVPLAVGPGG